MNTPLPAKTTPLPQILLAVAGLLSLTACGTLPAPPAPPKAPLGLPTPPTPPAP